MREIDGVCICVYLNPFMVARGAAFLSEELIEIRRSSLAARPELVAGGKEGAKFLRFCDFIYTPREISGIRRGTCIYRAPHLNHNRSGNQQILSQFSLSLSTVPHRQQRMSHLPHYIPCSCTSFQPQPLLLLTSQHSQYEKHTIIMCQKRQSPQLYLYLSWSRSVGPVCLSPPSAVC